MFERPSTQDPANPYSTWTKIDITDFGMESTVQIYVHPQATFPSRATEGSAGYDLTTRTRLVCSPWEPTLAPTGIHLSMPSTLEAQIRSRSGLALKKGIFVLNSPGTVDSDYRGELGVILLNTSLKERFFEPGERIAQLVFSPVVHPTWEKVSAPEELGETIRGKKGFGSTEEGKL